MDLSYSGCWMNGTERTISSVITMPRAVIQARGLPLTHAIAGGIRPEYEVGAVVGCGLDFSTSSKFFTKNGQPLGKSLLEQKNAGIPGSRFKLTWAHNQETVRSACRGSAFIPPSSVTVMAGSGSTLVTTSRLRLDTILATIRRTYKRYQKINAVDLKRVEGMRCTWHGNVTLF